MVICILFWNVDFSVYKVSFETAEKDVKHQGRGILDFYFCASTTQHSMNLSINL